MAGIINCSSSVTSNRERAKAFLERDGSMGPDVLVTHQASVAYLGSLDQEVPITV